MDAVTTFESSFEARETGQVQRLDVIPAGPARRRWTADAKSRIIAESMAPGANVSEVARRHGMVPQQLYAWRRKVGEQIEAADPTSFVPAMLEERRPSASTGVEIRIELNGVRVFVPDGASADHVERVLLAVQVTS